MGEQLLLDTNVVINLLAGKLDFTKELESAAGLHISAVTEAELYAGVAPIEIPDLQDILTEFKVIPLTSEVSSLAGALTSRLGRSQKGLKDMLIAATAELYDLRLVTSNKKDFLGLTTKTPLWV